MVYRGRLQRDPGGGRVVCRLCNVNAMQCSSEAGVVVAEPREEAELATTDTETMPLCLLMIAPLYECMYSVCM